MPSRDTVRAQTLALLNISLHYPKSAESLPFLLLWGSDYSVCICRLSPGDGEICSPGTQCLGRIWVLEKREKRMEESRAEEAPTLTSSGPSGLALLHAFLKLDLVINRLTELP